MQEFYTEVQLGLGQPAAKDRQIAERGFGVLMTTHSPDHALMLDSNVVLLQKERPMQFGHANHVITEKNMRDAYGVDVETKEFLTRDGQVMRLCAPAYSNAARSADAKPDRLQDKVGA